MRALEWAFAAGSDTLTKPNKRRRIGVAEGIIQDVVAAFLTKQPRGARSAGVGLGTLYRNFPTRDALHEALLRDRFEKLTAQARELEKSSTPDAALVAWLRETVAIAHAYSGSIKSMVAAIEDEASPLHPSCVTMKAAGARLLARAQIANQARADIDDADLFALVGALSWVADQPALASRSDHIFGIVAGAILTAPATPGDDTGS